MAIPVFYPVAENIIDPIDINLPVVKQSLSQQGYSGGLFVHYLLPDNVGGTVVVANHINSDNSQLYVTSTPIQQYMASIYSSGGEITPNYSDAITSSTQPFNFVGVALNSVSGFNYLWNEITVSVAPQPRAAHSLVFDTATNRSTLFGGINGSAFAETWEWNGVTWIQRLPSTSPSARSSHMAAYDVDRNRVVLYGGILNNSSVVAETWEWDTATWISRGVSTPGSLAAGGMIYDSFRRKTVMFGGQNNSSVTNSNTWEWDGSSWTQIITVASPSSRSFCMMAFDSSRNRTVLFGGLNASIPNGETWEYDGTNWIQIMLSLSPSPRAFASMIFDPQKKTVVLFGGVDANFRLLNDIWQYNGIFWTQLNIITPSKRLSAGLTYDSDRNKLVLFGGAAVGGAASAIILGDTWELETPNKPIFLQTAGESLVFWDASGIWPIAIGNLSRVGSTVTVLTTLPHTFGIGDSFVLTPGEINFITGTKTVVAVLDGYRFTYTEAGAAVSSSVAEIVETLFARPVPQLNDFLGPSAAIGTVTSTGDGYSPVFGIVSEAPIINSNTGNLYQTVTTNGSYVGLVKMRLNPFIGFIPPESPTITNFTPTFGTVGDGFIINGAGFLGVSAVVFNATATSSTFSVISNDQLLITVPAGAQTGTVSIMGILGTNTSVQTFHVIPLITSISASSHAVGGSLTITGHTFTHVDAITFNGVNQPIFTVVNDTSITTTIPAGASTGNIVVSNPDGSAAYNNFIVVDPPVIDSGGISPIIGAVGSSIAIVGSGFTSSGGAMDGYGVLTFVKVGGGQTLSTTREIFNDSQMSGVVPSIPTGQSSTSYNIVFTNDGGTATSIQTVSIIPAPAFLNSPGPTMSPILGPSGTVVDLFGKYGFSGTSEVFFDGYLATNLVLLVAQSIVGNTSRSGSTVTVNTVAAHNFTTGDVVFVEPSIDTNFPSVFATIAVSGAQVFTYTQNGSATTNSVTLTFIDDSHIKTTVPPTPILSDPNAAISIVAIGGITATTDTFASGTGITAPQHFTILLQPFITSFSPNFGATGAIIQIVGVNYTTVDRVFFTSHTATSTTGNTSRSGSTVTVNTVAAHNFTTGNTVLISSSDPNFPVIYTTIVSTGSMSFTYAQSGSSVSNTSTITFYDAIANAVFTIISNTQLNVIVPSQSTGIVNGPIIVSSGTLFAVSGNSFTYLPSPTIGSINKSSGGYGTPATTVTISGTNLLNSNSTAPTVTFGGVPAAISTYSPTSVIVIVPNGGNNGIVLMTDGGSSNIAFHVIQQPVIYNSTPTSACLFSTGLSLTINGNNFVQSDSTISLYFYNAGFNLLTTASASNNQLSVNDAGFGSLSTQSRTGAPYIYTIYLFVYYDGGAGSYQVVSPQTFTFNDCARIPRA